jgi:hypothetical protein
MDKVEENDSKKNQEQQVNPINPMKIIPLIKEMTSMAVTLLNHQHKEKINEIGWAFYESITTEQANTDEY